MTESDATIRLAEERDVPAIVAILASDSVGGHGDTTDPAALPGYLDAFRRIAASDNENIYVVESANEVVATFQTLVTTTLSGCGSSSMIIESVHTRSDCRGQGIGSRLIRYCLAEAERAGMRLVQLSSNVARKDAHRFYERLGFQQSHLGFKIKLK